jgi:hypothetical protein
MSQDFGDGGWVMGRKQHRCEACLGPIPKGEKHYHYQGKYDDEWQNWRMHEECHAQYLDGGDEFWPGDMPMPDRVRVLVREMPQ